jgi:hypothetical protein
MKGAVPSQDGPGWELLHNSRRRPMVSTSSQSKPVPPVDPVAFRERGYLIVRQLLDADEVSELRESAERDIAQAEREGRAGAIVGREGTIRTGPGDLLGNPSVRHMLFDPRVLGVIRQLLGGDPVYYGDSNFRIGKNGERGWHRDNADRKRYWYRDADSTRHWGSGPDWQAPYPIIRCAFYLQDQAPYSGGLALRPGSNRPGLLRPTLPMLVDARAGDFVVWELKTVHSAEVVRLRWLPNLPLHPRIQSFVPESMRVPERAERAVLFMTYARPGAQLDRCIEYLKTRSFMQDQWASSRFGPDTVEEAERAGLQVIFPVPTYGPQATAAGG